MDSKASASHVESVKAAQLPSAKQDSKDIQQGSIANSRWRQLQCDMVGLREALDEEERVLNIRKQELWEKETVRVNMLQNTVCEEQQAITRVEEELSQAKIAFNELEERMQNELARIRQVPDDEVRLRDTRERELREKETIVEQLKDTLGEEQQVRTQLEENLQTEMLASQARQQELQIKENADKEQRRLLEEERQLKTALEERQRVKETLIDQILDTLSDEQEKRNRLEEILQTEMFLNQAYQQDLQTKENANKEQQRLLGEERQQKTALEEKLREQKTIVEQLQNMLGEEQQVRIRLEERLQIEIFSSQAYQQELQTKENANKEQLRLLEEERQQKTASEERLREKEMIVEQLQNPLGEEQQARTQLEKRLQTEMLSSQAYQQELQTKENANREQQRLLEEERQQKTTLEERLRSFELQMQEERDRYLSNERELQSAVSAAQEELTEYQRRQPRDWIIQREEILLSDNVVGKGAWGSVRQGTFRGCQVAVKEIHELILSPHNRRLFEREMSIASCCRHPNLLQFIGATNDDGSPLFITEILDTSLRRLLFERALNDEEIVILALDVAKGINYLHLNRPRPIIHRDISSANVLLWRRDECWRAKLSDYGSANFMRQCMTENPGAIIYAAPEAHTSQQSPKVTKKFST